ncbi:8147_t:CDS:2 [Acaulospora morrowiae]|uniref:Guanine nucleotide-binding protein subunit gamma n=1 Tax=Acaulospora morrowiae TaxID=94023 RepID=A0A9N9AQR6_9GLOM|nr:8147_t:CDS:2 [Acaulospora morrowiae]
MSSENTPPPSNTSITTLSSAFNTTTSAISNTTSALTSTLSSLTSSVLPLASAQQQTPRQTSTTQQPETMRNQLSPSLIDGVNPKQKNVNNVTAEMFNKVAEYLKGEMLATNEDYKLLENMNNVTRDRYKEMSGMAQNLVVEMAKLQRIYIDIEPYIQQIDEVCEQIDFLEKVTSELDDYSKELDGHVEQKVCHIPSGKEFFSFFRSLRNIKMHRQKQQSMSEIKLRRLAELNQRLREDLDRPRVRVSEASNSLITYCKNTRDFLVPSVWGPVDKRDDPYVMSGGSCHCNIM